MKVTTPKKVGSNVKDFYDSIKSQPGQHEGLWEHFAQGHSVIERIVTRGELSAEDHEIIHSAMTFFAAVLYTRRMDYTETDLLRDWYEGGAPENRLRKFVRTGAFREPRQGEWYLNGEISQAWQAEKDLSLPFPILEEETDEPSQEELEKIVNSGA